MPLGLTFSYASKGHSLGRNFAIRAVERLSGQPFLKNFIAIIKVKIYRIRIFGSEVITRLDQIGFNGRRYASTMCRKTARLWWLPITLMGFWTAL